MQLWDAVVYYSTKKLIKLQKTEIQNLYSIWAQNPRKILQIQFFEVLIAKFVCRTFYEEDLIRFWLLSLYIYIKLETESVIRFLP